MKVYRVKDYDAMSRKGAAFLAAKIILKPNALLGLATGSTPAGTYKRLVEMYQAGDLDFSGIRTVNLDEYRGIQQEDPNSYYYFMNENLFSKVNILPENTHIPDGGDPDAQGVCREYEDKIERLGPIEVQLLGLGHDGHIAFNEPGDEFPDQTHCARLDRQTIEANKRFFPKEQDVPRQAYTMGIGTIMKARSILMLVSGREKAEILKKVLEGPVTPKVPGSILRFHPDVTIIADEAALGGGQAQ